MSKLIERIQKCIDFVVQFRREAHLREDLEAVDFYSEKVRILKQFVVLVNGSQEDLVLNVSKNDDSANEKFLAINARIERRFADLKSEVLAASERFNTPPKMRGPI